MERYFRIQNNECSYEGEFVTADEAKSYLQARNDEEIQRDIESKQYYAWAIAEVEEKPFGAVIHSITAFDFVNDKFIFNETINYK